MSTDTRNYLQLFLNAGIENKFVLFQQEGKVLVYVNLPYKDKSICI